MISFPGSVVKNVPAKGGDKGLIPGSGRSSGEGNSNPLQHSCLENPIHRGIWQATIHEITKSQIQLKTEHSQRILTYRLRIVCMLCMYVMSVCICLAADLLNCSWKNSALNCL